MERRKRILVAVLDWGLGHATRCIPIIDALLQRNQQVLIASSAGALQLLEEQYPTLEKFELKPYNPVYPDGDGMIMKMATQLPKFLEAIKAETIETERLVKEKKIDLVISDNRYGCYSKKAKSVFITHQLNIKMPWTHKWMEREVRKYNFKQIKNYSECWVPTRPADFTAGLIGDITEINGRHIGYLSRLEFKTAKKKYDLLAICSGPEPQRTLFENLARQQMVDNNLKCLLVKGLPGNGNNSLTKSGNLHEVDFMNAAQLNEALAQSDLILARSGYSTIMDLIKLRKKAIFIPTPGQTEQEFLADELKEQGITYSESQKRFDLTTALNERDNYSGFMNFEEDNSLLNHAIDSII